MTPAVQAESPVMGGKCDSGPAGMGGVSMSGGDSNQAGSGFAGMGDSIGPAGKCDNGGKCDNCAGMSDKKTPEVAQGGAAQVYNGQTGWEEAN